MRIETYRQSNGLDVVLVEHPVAPVVAIEIWVRAGAADERDDQCGLAHVHEHMIFKGTERRGVGDIARDVEAAGGEINARTSFDYTVYHIEMSSRFFESGLDTLADAIQNPAFDPDELARELEVIVEEIKRGDDSPGHSASQLLFETAFAGHAYGRRIIGTAEQVRGFDRERVLEFFSTWYVPGNMSLVIVGDIDIEATRELVASSFDAPVRPDPPRALPRPSSARPRPEVALLSRDTSESYLHMAFDIPGLDHEDIPALDVLSIVLGGTTSSRLDVRIKQELDLVNSIGTYAYTPLERGVFTVSATFQTADDADPVERAREVVEAVVTEVIGYATSALAPDAIERATTLIACQSVYEKQTMRGLAQKFGYYRCMAGDLDAERRYFEAVAAVGVDDVRRVAARYLALDGLTVVLMSPESRETPDADQVLDWLQSSASRATRRQHDCVVDDEGVARTTLDGGPELVIESTRDTGLVTLWLSVPGGKRHERPEHAGVAQLTASLMTRGTRSRSAIGLSEAFETMGGSLNVFGGHNTMSLSATFLAEHLHRATELVGEVLLEPAFEAGELEREQRLQLEDIQAMRDQPATLAFRRLAETLYGEHPYGRSSLGTPETVASLDEDAVRGYHASCLAHPSRVAALVGDASIEAAVEVLGTWLRWPVEATDALALPEPPTLDDGPRLELIEVPSRQQAHIAVGFPGARLADPERHVLEVIAAVLSGQGGRLFRELRDRQSLAYSVSAFSRPDLDRGYFGLYIATSVEKVPVAMDALDEQLLRLREQAVSTAELQRARRYLVGSHDVSLQQGSTRASLMALNTLYGMGHAHHRDYAQRIEAVDAEAIASLAQRWLSRKRAVIAVAAPPGFEVPDPRG